MMNISINSIQLAEKLADDTVSFKAENKTKVEFGIDYTKENVREQEEWKELFKKYHTIILEHRDI